ncbi:hypothetical protein OOT00_05220 [Desulfobotulus sp. H1]|uniref:DUF2007 domain-containing protein n=1 Tax=Desulfobotulus pelophilus TaxID=2823377 RepID=A0ABT3N7E9_9BACT|nr:hypothetical protein [Desulfobotulus pelophilus]MCW7753385.1 hypothetical protein [Desulfobotulus pelophilus]
MDRFASIASFRDLPLAELAKAKLESEGLYCHLLNRHHVGMNWLYSEAIGGVQLQVRSEDIKLAESILARDESGLLEEGALDFPAAENIMVCIACGAGDLEAIQYTRLSGALMLLTHMPLLFWGKGYRCRKCGKKQK